MLWFATAGGLTITWWRPDQTAENNAERERQLAQQKGDLDKLEKNLNKALDEYKRKSNASNSPTADRTAERFDTTGAGREPEENPPLPHHAEAKRPAMANAEPSTAPAKPSAPSENSDTGLLIDLFNSFVLDRPLKNEEDVLRARAATTTLAELLRGKREVLPVSGAKRILQELSARDVPKVYNDLKPKPELDVFIHFAFLTTGSEQTVALATLRDASRSTTKSAMCYQLDLQEPLSWKDRGQQASIKGYFDFMASTLSGNILALGQTKDGLLQSYTLVKPERLYDLKHRLKELAPEAPRPIEATKFAMSDRGELVAIVRPASEQKGKLPSVVVRQMDGKEILPGHKEISPDFEEVSKYVEGSKVKEISFDHMRQNLIVGFESESSLLAFPLTAERPKPRRYSYPGPVLGWSHSFDQRLAVVTEKQVFVENLIEMSDTTKIGIPLPETGFVIVPHRCVALSPKGTILATGDDKGVVTIRLSHGGGTVLRLAHEGQILKLGFSPSGRVLAALVKRRGDIGEVQQGIIRLWVTKNWDQNDMDPIGTSPAAAEMRPDESRRRRQSAHLAQSRVSPADKDFGER
jgi:hypothetical protein